jgi:predicted secreted protein
MKGLGMKKAAAWAILAALGLLPAAWAESPALTITEKDNGRAYTVKVDQKIVVDLRHPGDGGYDILTPEYDVKVLMILGMKKRTAAPSGPRRLGDFGRTEYHFEALKEGGTDLVVNIKRPWEKQSQVYLQVKIKVVR